ncbi:trehalose 6-phosphate phosphatase [Nonomuraea solani]|uniref:Trehalose 6-phosphate phosphatase n=1 Tax=Nonomuraea solani TaxID=1144553 RepID=A0A1H6EXP8_9ACTN|nr:trehalose-phosphatase [Nonomuraea solani]SEH01726.1 trehalose 6-phosphate phosphatase [Nonomuraea solani]
MEAILSDPAGAVIGLDFDGTLAPIVPDPAKAVIHPKAPGILADLGAHVLAVVIVTGRPAATALELGPGLADVPGLVVLGHYGFERWEGGRISAPPPPPGVPRAEAELPLLLDSLGLEGVTIEDKGRAVAVHTRRSPDPEGALARLREPLAALAGEHGLVIEPGRLVLELRPPGMDKGQALSLFLAERAARSVMFVGDDLGDLSAFEAVRASGLPGVTVCSGSTEVKELAERADIVVDGPEGVVALLTETAAAFSRS